ncbi:MAG: hypothetical protein ABEK04_04595 [Candidatus Nanohalobium sp.]
MERKNLAILASVFAVSVVVGFGVGELTGPEKKEKSGKFMKDVSFTANSSNPVTEASFDNRNMSLIVQPGKNASFYLGFNGTVKALNNLLHDGDIHELRKMKALGGKTYLLYFRYSDDANVTGDGWLTLYRVREL